MNTESAKEEETVYLFYRNNLSSDFTELLGAWTYSPKGAQQSAVLFLISEETKQCMKPPVKKYAGGFTH